MQSITTIGLDIAKSVFQVHGVDANGLVVIRRQLKRRYVLAFFEKLPPCLVGIEACASVPSPLSPYCHRNPLDDLMRSAYGPLRRFHAIGQTSEVGGKADMP
jgi:hypothetical protein